MNMKCKHGAKLIRIITIILINLIYGFKAQQHMLQHRHGQVCKPISIPMCQEMPYNGTSMPNLLHHRTQEEAAIMVL